MTWENVGSFEPVRSSIVHATGTVRWMGGEVLMGRWIVRLLLLATSAVLLIWAYEGADGH